MLHPKIARPLAKGTQQVVVVAGHPHEEALLTKAAYHMNASSRSSSMSDSLTQWQVRWQQHEPVVSDSYTWWV